MKSWMTSRQWAATWFLLVLVGLAITGLVLTNNPNQGTTARGRRAQVVNERLLQTARKAESLAVTREEHRFAREAVRLADKELDLAFADALREASQKMAELTPEARELYQRVTKAQALVDAAELRVDQIKKELATAKTRRAEELQRQFELAKSEAELAHDELEDVQGALRRSGADPQSRVRRQFERHQAAQHDGEAASAPRTTNPPVPDPTTPFDAVSQFRAWYAVREAMQQLKEAREEVLAAVAALKNQHDTRERQRSADNATSPVVAQTAESGSAIAQVQQRAEDLKSAARLGKRMDAAQELADLYANWTTSLQSRQARALHGLLRCALAILVIVLVLYLLTRAVDRVIPELAAERNSRRTLRALVRFTLQALSVLLVALVTFGTPSQLSTILGLAGAGLTVALKDFIISFFGWFVLMGRNGIRTGDWVEINGVAGEVVEINLLRTVLLETGNWTETGHPTGRRVAFMNGYAIEGHFFNFSTAGQWLWDELKVAMPATENPYPVMDSIQRLVSAETEANARAAEQEWQRAAGRYRISQSLTASPTMYVRPAGSGVEICVRYISRASERSATRARLYQAVFQLLHVNQTPQKNSGSAITATSSL